MLSFVFKTLIEGGRGKEFLNFMENNHNFKRSLGFKVPFIFQGYLRGTCNMNIHSKLLDMEQPDIGTKHWVQSQSGKNKHTSVDEAMDSSL